MICNYQNITDYCNNKFTYQYITTPISSSGDMITSVIRTDKDTGEKITISSDSNLFVEPCDNNDILEVISYWECYKIYVSNNNLVLQPSLETLNANQKNNVFSSYDNNIQDGVSIKIENSNTIVINSSIENQIHLGNIICLANILYAKNSNSVMPYILDINNAAYYLNYATLKQVLGEYFKKTAQTKRVKDDLIHQLNTVSSSDDISNKYYCDNKVSSNIIQVNKFIDYENYKEVSLIPPEVCDPPCDPINGQECVNGVCVDIQPTGTLYPYNAKICGAGGKDTIISQMTTIAEDARSRGFYYAKIIYGDINTIPGDWYAGCTCAEAIGNDGVYLATYCNGTIDTNDVGPDRPLAVWNVFRCEYSTNTVRVPRCNT